MSNGSEHTPERCVHAVDGPDWAGLREPTSWKERAITAEAENAQLKAKLDMPCGSCHPCTQWANQTWINAGLQLPHVIDWQELKAERDALQARLDAMTTDFRLRRMDVVNGKVAEVEPFYEQRLVGPWTVVPEGDGNV